MRFRSLLPLLAFVLALPLMAQSVRWQVTGNSLAIGQVSDVALIFENCDVDGEIKIPAVPNLDMGQPQRGEQSSTRIINGRTTSQSFVYYSFPSRPLSNSPVEIPAFTIQTTAGPQSVPALRLSVREATLGDTSIRITDIASSQLKIGDGSELWVGEVVPIDYTLTVSARFSANLASNPTWEPAPVIVESWGEPSAQTDGAGRTGRSMISYLARGYIAQPGTYTVGSVQQLLNIGVPTTGLFPSLRAEQFSITSDAPQIVVRPLPSPAPASFGGAVGDFKLSSNLVPETAVVGEPVTWTLRIEGTGNWPLISSLPARQVSKSFRVVQPDAKRENPEGKLFDGSITEDVVLIPTTAGTFTMGPVTWTYFDPGTGNYRTVTTPAHELRVNPSAPIANNAGRDPGSASPSDANGGGANIDANAPIRATPAPDAPSALPLDPLDREDQAPAPQDLIYVLGVCTGYLLVLPVFWLCLSFRHAKRSDPGRFAREARRQLPVLITRVEQAADSGKRASALLEWQRTTATLWQSARKAPSSDMFGDDETWAQLWREADRALYASDESLPVDWAQRARVAAVRKRAPRFPVLRCLSLKHLFPVLVVLFTFGLTTAPRLHAADTVDPLTSYRQGNFADAEAQWRKATDSSATDWVSRHNLALALAQQNRWDEAGAHAAVAFVQHPQDASVRWHLNYTLERSGYTPPVFGRFLHPGWAEKLARLASPAQWQSLLVAAAAGLTLAFALLIWRGYEPRLRGAKPVAWLLIIAAIGTAVCAGFSLQTYGLTAETNAALTWRSTALRSIPTDLDEEQQTTTLAPGSLARVEKAFLGWRQVSFPNGQTGWLRKEELIGLWQKP